MTAGDALPPRTIHVERASLVQYAGASLDRNRIHWDERFATSVGLPDVIAHGMFTMGSAISVVTDWLGDAGRVLEYGTRFTKPVVVPWEGGADIEVSAVVKSVDPEDRAGHDRPHRASATATRCSAAPWPSWPSAEPVRTPMREEHGTPLSTLTTMRVGGPAQRLVTAETTDELVDAVREVDDADEPLLVVSGGSNLLIADEGFPGSVVRVATTGITVESQDDCGGAAVRVAAGESWDGLVARAVAEGWSGIEALSGIPGATGATPIQNVGAYGQEVAQTIAQVRVWDRREQQVRTFANADCVFTYRHSRFKAEPRYVVLDVLFQLRLADALRAGGLRRPRARPRGRGRARACRWRTRARPCWPSDASGGWCWTPTTPTPGAAGPSSPTRCCPPSATPPCATGPARSWAPTRRPRRSSPLRTTGSRPAPRG